jgi:[NiFe] hydrogenase diaphorase moiety small subunit
MRTHPRTWVVDIDGQSVPFQEGQSVLQAALDAGLNIPHLCYRPELEPIGSCRLCLVEVDGQVASACTLTATEGQMVHSNNQRLHKLRLNLVGMLLEHGRHACTRCERTSDCRLQDIAGELNVPAPQSQPSLELPSRDDSHPDVTLDRDHCILCGICIQASRDLDGKKVFGFAGSGGKTSLIVDSASGLLKDSTIAADDHAVRLCPVGALIVIRPSNTNELTSFDYFDTADWNS